jgi:hypothetical protein
MLLETKEPADAAPMNGASVPVVARKATGKTRLRSLADLDQRTSAARWVRKTCDEIIAESGGSVGRRMALRIEDYVLGAALLRDLFVRRVMGEDIPVTDHVSLRNTQHRDASQIGFDAAPEQPSLAEYLRAAQEPQRESPAADPIGVVIREAVEPEATVAPSLAFSESIEDVGGAEGGIHTALHQPGGAEGTFQNIAAPAENTPPPEIGHSILIEDGRCYLRYTGIDGQGEVWWIVRGYDGMRLERRTSQQAAEKRALELIEMKKI